MHFNDLHYNFPAYHYISRLYLYAQSHICAGPWCSWTMIEFFPVPLIQYRQNLSDRRSFELWAAFIAAIFFSRAQQERCSIFYKKRAQSEGCSQQDWKLFSFHALAYIQGWLYVSTRQISSISMECLHISKQNFLVKCPYGCSLYLLIIIFQQDLSLSKQ